MGNLEAYDVSEFFGENGELEKRTYDPIPKGDYKAEIIESSWQETKNGSGKFLKLKYKLLDGEHKDRFVWCRLNLENQNEQAVSIARRQLAEICAAVGEVSVSDSYLLHGRPMIISIVVREAKGDFDASNDVAGFKKIAETLEDEVSGADGIPF